MASDSQWSTSPMSGISCGRLRLLLRGMTNPMTRKSRAGSQEARYHTRRGRPLSTSAARNSLHQHRGVGTTRQIETQTQLGGAGIQIVSLRAMLEVGRQQQHSPIPSGEERLAEV